MSIPITNGTGASSVAAEAISGLQYQQIKIVGGETGSTSVLGVTPDGSFKASIIGIPTVSFSGNGSIIAVPTGTQNVSGSVIARNITPSSLLVGASVIGLTPVNITNTNVNVSGSVVSFVNGTVPVTIIGSVLSKEAPLTSIIQGTADLRVVQGASVAVIAAPGASIRNYIRYVQVVNYGSASVLVTIADNTTSILGYTIAPAGGGSNYDCFYRAAANSPVTASINGTASVLVSMQGFTS